MVTNHVFHSSLYKKNITIRSDIIRTNSNVSYIIVEFFMIRGSCLVSASAVHPSKRAHEINAVARKLKPMY